jgi:Flp pilus assembly CpaF family ATPase
MLILTLAEKGGDSKDLSFDKTEIRVGRVRDNDIVLPKGNVSKHHCHLLLQDGQLVVEDLGSTNGTYVNGRKITEATSLGTADKVFVGDFVIRVTSGVRGAESQPGILPPPPPYASSAPEAGSLSTALPRRPPPPPPPPPPRPPVLRGADEGSGPLPTRGSALHVPPPPPKRESKPMPAVTAEAHLAPSLPTEISLDDDDSLSSPAPRLNLPPLKPPVPVLPPSPSPDEPRTMPRGTPAPLVHEPERPAMVAPPPVPPPPAAPALTAPSSAAPSSAAFSPSILPPTPPQASGDYPRWLAHLLDSDDATAAFFAGTQSVEVERNGHRESAVVASADLASLPDHLRRLAGKGVPRPEPDAPVIDTTLADGTRITALFPPLCDRVYASIRRPNVGHKTLEELVADGSLSPEMQQLLEACVGTRQNLLIAGDRPACDLLLGTLAWSLDRVARVVVLAETISPPASAATWLKLPVAARTPDLVAAAIALRPDYVVADAAAFLLLGDLLRECARGQNGVLTALIARSANDALYRLRVMGAASGPSSTPNDLLGSSLDMLVYAVTQTDGSVRVMEIAEPTLGSAGELRAETLFAWQSKGKGKGRFIATRVSSRLAGKLEAGGVSVPDNVLQR